MHILAESVLLFLSSQLNLKEKWEGGREGGREGEWLVCVEQDVLR